MEERSVQRRLRSRTSQLALWLASRDARRPHVRKLVLLSVLIVGTLSAAGVASACHESKKPVFHPSECTYDKSTGFMRCEKIIGTETYELTWTSAVADETCESGERLMETTDLHEEAYYTYGIFVGPAPVSCVDGNEGIAWNIILSSTTRDLGCV